MHPQHRKAATAASAYLDTLALVLLKDLSTQAAKLPDAPRKVLTARQELRLARVKSSSLTALLSSSSRARSRLVAQALAARGELTNLQVANKQRL